MSMKKSRWGSFFFIPLTLTLSQMGEGIFGGNYSAFPSVHSFPMRPGTDLLSALPFSITLENAFRRILSDTSGDPRISSQARAPLQR